MKTSHFSSHPSSYYPQCLLVHICNAQRVNMQGIDTGRVANPSRFNSRDHALFYFFRISNFIEKTLAKPRTSSCNCTEVRGKAGQRGSRTGQVYAESRDSLLLQGTPLIKSGQSLLVSMSGLIRTQPLSHLRGGEKLPEWQRASRGSANPSLLVGVSQPKETPDSVQGESACLLNFRLA